MVPTIPATMSPTVRVWIAGSALLVLALCMFFVLVWLRRRISAAGQRGSGEAFAVESLEQMRSSGRISAEEYRKLRRRLLGVDECEGEKADSTSRTPRKNDDGKGGSDRTGSSADKGQV